MCPYIKIYKSVLKETNASIWINIFVAVLCVIFMNKISFLGTSVF